VCVCVCVCVCTCICVRARTCKGRRTRVWNVCTRARAGACAHYATESPRATCSCCTHSKILPTDRCMYVCMACMNACMNVCMYACMQACMYICMYVCMHACMHVYIYYQQQDTLGHTRPSACPCYRACVRAALPSPCFSLAQAAPAPATRARAGTLTVGADEASQNLTVRSHEPVITQGDGVSE